MNSPVLDLDFDTVSLKKMWPTYFYTSFSRGSYGVGGECDSPNWMFFFPFEQSPSGRGGGCDQPTFTLVAVSLRNSEWILVKLVAKIEQSVPQKDVYQPTFT